MREVGEAKIEVYAQSIFKEMVVTLLRDKDHVFSRLRGLARFSLPAILLPISVLSLPVYSVPDSYSINMKVPFSFRLLLGQHEIEANGSILAHKTTHDSHGPLLVIRRFRWFKSVLCT